MRHLPVADETLTRAVELQEADNLGSDSLINLALDAFELMRELHTGDEPAEGVPRTVRRWEERFDACREGSHYVEVAAPVEPELSVIRETTLVAGDVCRYCHAHVQAPAHACHVTRGHYRVEPVASRKAPDA